MAEKYDAPVQLNDGVHWIGYTDTDSVFRTNAYLIESGNEIALIDAGSAVYFDSMFNQIEKLIDVNKIEYFIQHHQDPDLCASLPFWEKKLGPKKILAHTKANILIWHYGVSSQLVNVDEVNWELKLPDRTLKFIFMPYMHSPGEIMTYDPKTRILFSGDIFGGLSMDWNLYANEYYMDAMEAFMENYMPSTEIVNENLKRIEGLEIDMICPQHGSIIPKERVGEAVTILKELECGSYLYE